MGQLRVEKLDWYKFTSDTSFPSLLNRCDLVFGADLVYDYEPTTALVGTLHKLLTRKEKTEREVFLAMKLRGCDPFNYLLFQLQQKQLFCEEVTSLFPVYSFFEYDRTGLHLFRISPEE